MNKLAQKLIYNPISLTALVLSLQSCGGSNELSQSTLLDQVVRNPEKTEEDVIKHEIIFNPNLIKVQQDKISEQFQKFQDICCCYKKYLKLGLAIYHKFDLLYI